MIATRDLEITLNPFRVIMSSAAADPWLLLLRLTWPGVLDPERALLFVTETGISFFIHSVFSFELTFRKK